MTERSKNRLFTVFKILLSILVILMTVLFVMQLMKLSILSSNLLMIAICVVGVLDLVILAILCFGAKKTGSRILCSILAVVLIAGYGFGSYYLGQTNNALSMLTSENGKVKNVIRVYALNSSSIDDEKDLNHKTVGILKSINKGGTDRLIQSLKKEGVTVETQEFANFGPLANALYEKKVDAIVVNDVYLPNITELEKFTDFNDKAKAVYTFEYYTDITANANGVSSITTEPFTVMINGSDSRGGLGNTDRSDVNMIAAINPNTGVVLLVSIPRDAYVETTCDAEYECLNGQYDKLTHTGIHTYNTTKQTIEKLMGIKINYTFRANFAAVIDIVDALGGIDVDVKPGYAVERFYTSDMFDRDYGVTEGINHLNGEAALAYARERYGYVEGDFQRIRNQQEVLTAIAKKATSPDVITRYASLLDTIDGNFWTDIAQNQITDLIQFQINHGPTWSFISYALSGQPDNRYCAEAYNYASVVILDQNTVKFGKELIDAVLDGKSAEEIEKMIADHEPQDPDYSLDESVETQEPAVDSEEDYYQVVQDPVTENNWTPPVNNTYNPGYVDPGYTAPVIPDQPVVDPGYTEPAPVIPEPVVPEPVVPEPVVPDQPGTDTGVVDPAADPAAQNAQQGRSADNTSNGASA